MAKKITVELIRELRERTQAGMGDCKNALEEADGDMEKAIENLQKKGRAKSAKKAGAVATEGEVRALLGESGKVGVIVEVNIQTDFAARNDKFKEFVGNVATVALASTAGADLDKATYPGTSKTVAAVRDELIGTIGEKITVRRWAKVELSAPCGTVHSYVHMGGKIGVLVEAVASSSAVVSHPEFVKFVDDVAMQIAAMNPLYVARGDVPAAAAAKQREIYAAQLKEDKKPEQAWAKITEGKLNKWYTEVCLLDQESVIVSGSSIDKVRAEASKAAGAAIDIKRFVRFERGEGVEKPSGPDFASEVAKMAGN